jgi:hypothetical protein
MKLYEVGFDQKNQMPIRLIIRLLLSYRPRQLRLIDSMHIFI